MTRDETSIEMAFLGLDLTQGAGLASSDSYGDWFRDPWSWPELSPDFVSLLTHEDIEVTKEGSRYQYVGRPVFHVYDVPKSFLGIRPAVIQDSRSRLAFATAASSLGSKLHEDLPDWVFGWRYRGEELPGDEWSSYKASQSDIGANSHAAQTDITSFFASVNIDRLLESIVSSVGQSASTSIIDSVLKAHDSLSNRSGLPQRSRPSSILAQLAIRPVDDVIMKALEQGKIRAARRWMDDLSFEGSEADLFEVMREIQQSSRQAGLELNLSKTFITSGADSAGRLREEAQRLIQVETREEGGWDEYDDSHSTYMDATALLEAEARIIEAPQQSSRTTVGLVLRSLRHYEMFDSVNSWANIARYLPHAADHLSRFLADATVELFSTFSSDDWFTSEITSAWPHSDWVSAQHALAVPSAEASSAYRAVLQTWLSSASNAQKVAVAVQRLTIEPSGLARSTIRGRLDHEHDPLLVRLLALGFIRAGGDSTIAENALSHHSSNALILAYMRAKRWVLPKVAKDFDPVGPGE